VTSTPCASCGTELSPDALVCPACAALVHSEQLKQLAADAEAATRAGDAAGARNHWTAAVALLPADAQQHAVIRERLAELTRSIDTTSSDGATAGTEKLPWWRRGWPGLATGALLLVSKLKFLLLGLTKASTFVSMFAFFGVYWSIYGWPLALGLVFSIYIHEMGHVAMLSRCGIAASAPMFIPGLGALVQLKQRVDDPLTDAKIGLAGPIWGLGAAIAALAVYELSHAKIWLAIAQLTAFLNLFNLTPIWQLDGSRGVHVLARGERWALVAAIAVALLLTEQRLLFVVGAVAVWRSFQRDAGPGDTRTLATFVMLIIALAWLARGVG
jgi:Zn-dependent protease